MIACEIRTTGASAILEKIMELQREIAIINLHERVHLGESGRFEPSCSYCNPEGPRARPVLEERKKGTSSLCELERCVEGDGKSGSVLVPKSWTGRKVKVVLLE